MTQECAQDRVYEGRIDQSLLKRLITEKLATLFYTSGPPSFVEDLSALKALDVANAAVSYPALKAELPESLPHLASPSPTLGRVGEVLGEAPQAQRVAPTLLFLKELKKR